MFGGESFGSQAFGATGDDLAPGKVCEGGVSIDDYCACTPETGTSIDDCDC